VIGGTVTIVVPAVVAIAIGILGYRQAVKVASKNAKVQSEQLNLQTFTDLNAALNKEIDRVRADRTEDQERAARDLSAVTEKLAANTKACEEMGRKLVKIETWADAVIRILQHPAIATAISENGIVIPPPPID
jgi:hypothetical protein